MKKIKKSEKKNVGNLLQVALLGNPSIRSKAKPIQDITDPLIQQLIDDMIATVLDVDGVGIAAPQVYKGYRVFIVASHPNPRYPYAPVMKPTAIINPVISKMSVDIIKDWEGCLSIPGVRALVPRHKEIEIEYYTRDGKKKKEVYTDFVARIFQHEYDHLDGIVFLDRLEDTKDIYMEKEFQKIIAKRTQK